MNINFESILAKARACMESSEGRSKTSVYIDDIIMRGITPKGEHSNIHTVEEAGEKFASILHDSMVSNISSENVVSAIDDIGVGKPYAVGDGYEIIVSIDSDLHRESLDPEKFPEGLYDLAALFDHGAPMHGQVEGIWHGKQIKSTWFTPASNFSQEAISDFMGNYAAEYNVLGITHNESR